MVKLERFARSFGAEHWVIFDDGGTQTGDVIIVYDAPNPAGILILRSKEHVKNAEGLLNEISRILHLADVQIYWSIYVGEWIGDYTEEGPAFKVPATDSESIAPAENPEGSKLDAIGKSHFRKRLPRSRRRPRGR